MAWKILVFETARGEKPVEEFLKSLDPATIAKASHAVDLLEKHGPFLSLPHSKRLTKEISELRIRGKIEVRILYTIIKETAILLHVFKKQTRKTPLKEIKTALRHLNSVR